MRRVDDVSPVTLLDDEAAAVRARVAKSLVGLGHELVPVAELERIEAAAAAGRLVLEGDQSCQAPLGAAEVHARYFAGRPSAEVSATCFEDDCSLTVMLDDPAHPDAFIAYEGRKVSRPYDPRAWVSAAGRLRASDSFGMGGLGLFGTSHSPPVRFNPPTGIGPWGAQPPRSEPFDALEPVVAGCAHPDPLVGFTWQVRVAVDRRGKVERCGARSAHSSARASDGDCVCRAIETIGFPAGSAGRRLRVDAVDDGGFRGSGHFVRVQPGTEVWVERFDEAPALARCLADHPPPADFVAQVSVALALDGTVDDVRIEGDITTTPTMRFASCLVNELRRVPLPCRPPGVDTLQLKLTMGPT